MIRKTFVTKSPEETRRLASKFAQILQKGDFIAFQGPMGAGKTVFTQGVAEGLGITDPVSSPTFAILNEYAGGKIPLYHFDLYRISGPDDLASIGFFDLLEEDAVFMVEWSGLAGWALPEGAITVAISAPEPDGDTREIMLEGDSRLENFCF